MPTSGELIVGPRIRRYRERLGWTLRALSERAGLSPNAISLIERGENSPTVSSLNQLAQALGVPITAFFQEPDEKLTAFVKRDQGLHYRKNGRIVEWIGAGLLNQQLEAFAVTVEPGAGVMDEPIIHPGEEFVRCLKGRIEFFVETRRYQMETGDNLQFDATQAHSFRNIGQAPADLLVIIHAGGEHQLARDCHLSRQTGNLADLSQ